MLNLFAPKLKRPPPHTFAWQMYHLGALGLFFVAILDSSPIPTFGAPDILTAVLSAAHKAPWWQYAVTATAGSITGAYITFRLARKAGSAYLDKKFKKGKVSKFLKVFKKWGTGSLAASAIIPLPTPTTLFFAAAGASDYPLGKFLIVVALCRAIRYSVIALVADLYGRRFIRAMRHPMQYWGWMLLFVAVTLALIAGGILINRRLESAEAK